MPSRYPSVAQKVLKPIAGDGLHRVPEVLKEKLHVAIAGDVKTASVPVSLATTAPSASSRPISRSSESLQHGAERTLRTKDRLTVIAAKQTWNLMLGQPILRALQVGMPLTVVLASAL